MTRAEHRTFVLEQWPDSDGLDDVNFRLVYDGALPSEQRGSPTVKHQIRRRFHPQLQTLWTQHPALRDMMKRRASEGGPDYRTVDKIAADYAKCGFQFVPLVRHRNWLACRLEILVLMREEPYHVFEGDERGDLDNRIKTLIDGLRMPRQCSELGGAVPTPGEDPFFCLLEDDKSIYEFNVHTDRLLAPARPGEAERDVVAIVSVQITNADRSEMATLSEGFGRL